MHRRIILIMWAFFLFSRLSLQSQNDSLNFSLLSKPITFKNVDVQYELINSFIKVGSTPIVIYGLNIGITELIPLIRTGLGFYYVNSNYSQARFVDWNPEIEQKAKGATLLNYNRKKVYLGLDEIFMFYVMPNFQVKIIKTKWFDISVNTAIGLGYSSKKTLDYFTNTELPLFVKNKIVNNSALFLPYSFGGVINLNLSPNTKIMSLAGYRVILGTIGTSDDFDGWYYQVGLKVKFLSVIKEIQQDWKDWRAKKNKLNT